jgi:hypothetical protein
VASRQASADPTFQMGGEKFAALDAMTARDQKEKDLKLADPKHDRYAQDSLGHRIIPCYLFHNRINPLTVFYEDSFQSTYRITSPCLRPSKIDEIPLVFFVHIYWCIVMCT